MKVSKLLVIMLMSILLFTINACEKKSSGGEQEVVTEGEESGLRLAIDTTYDAVRNGVRLTLAYDNTSSSFLGNVENITNQTIFLVRVEVHLSDGTELGPTTPVELVPGAKASVNLPVEGQLFSWWKAHAESSEKGGEEGGDHEGEHKEGDEHKTDDEHSSEGEHKSEGS